MNQTLSGNGQVQRVRSCLRNYFTAGVLLLLLYLLLHKGFSPTTAGGWALVWGDGFAMSGVLLLCLTGFIKLDRIGLLDWVGYSMQLSKFLFRRCRDEEYIAFYDYKQLREHSTAPLWPGVVISVIWFLIGLILSTICYIES